MNMQRPPTCGRFLFSKGNEIQPNTAKSSDMATEKLSIAVLGCSWLFLALVEGSAQNRVHLGQRGRPQIAPHVDRIVLVEHHALALEADALLNRRLGRALDADAAARVHDAMPWDGRLPTAEVVQRPANRPRAL